MSSENDLIAAIRWTSEAQVDESLEPDNFIVECRGEVEALDTSGDEKVVGAFNTYYVDVEAALAAKMAPDQVFDANGLLDAVMPEIIDPSSGQPTEFASKLVGEVPWSRNVLIIEALRLLPAYRGVGLGRQVIRTIAAKLGAGASILGICSAPLESGGSRGVAIPAVDENLELDRFKGSSKEAEESIKRFLVGSGFYEVGDVQLMIKPLRKAASSEPTWVSDILSLH